MHPPILGLGALTPTDESRRETLQVLFILFEEKCTTELIPSLRKISPVGVSKCLHMDKNVSRISSSTVASNICGLTPRKQSRLRLFRNDLEILRKKNNPKCVKCTLCRTITIHIIRVLIIISKLIMIRKNNFYKNMSPYPKASLSRRRTKCTRAGH